MFLSIALLHHFKNLVACHTPLLLVPIPHRLWLFPTSTARQHPSDWVTCICFLSWGSHVAACDSLRGRSALTHPLLRKDRGGSTLGCQGRGAAGCSLLSSLGCMHSSEMSSPNLRKCADLSVALSAMATPKSICHWFSVSLTHLLSLLLSQITFQISDSQVSLLLWQSTQDENTGGRRLSDGRGTPSWGPSPASFIRLSQGTSQGVSFMGLSSQKPSESHGSPSNLESHLSLISCLLSCLEFISTWPPCLSHP